MQGYSKRATCFYTCIFASDITVYTYDSFDEKGNWTKRTIKRKEVEDNSNKQTHYVEYRTITYYP